jgi:anion-transporting  ArsA/GET3 family ATPase
VSVDSLLEGRSICICAGAGGVGKTTTAAAIALGAAARGRRVAVLTIDPARRLAGALGLPELGNEERQVDIAVKGELWAMMLDPKRTFDDLVESYAPDERTRDAVLSNRIYQELSAAVAGSTEYMAMEKLYELHAEGRYDLLVLDTPPTRNALDFLEAPERLSGFIDSRSLKLLLAPGRRGLKVLSRGTGLIFSVLERVTGVDLLADLSAFFNSFGGMAEGFRERALRVRELLGAPETVFVLVSSPQRSAVDEAIFFRRRLAEAGMPFGGVIVNRMHEEGLAKGKLGGAADELLGEALGRKVARTFDDYRRLAERDRDNVARLASELDGEPIVRVPYFDEDVYDLAGLKRMDDYLFARSTRKR